MESDQSIHLSKEEGEEKLNNFKFLGGNLWLKLSIIGEDSIMHSPAWCSLQTREPSRQLLEYVQETITC